MNRPQEQRPAPKRRPAALTTTARAGPRSRPTPPVPIQTLPREATT